ncbi:MAG: T9SS type A sorting domain-containing protein, partial [Saprospiraceae bacterium]|nr:T9SS type A sorting domain-containing protein [Saprospiraceae bacterium]
IQSTSVTIIPATPIEVGAVIVNESAAGVQNGSVVLNVQGGDCVTYDYLWNTGATTSALVNLSAGIYTATVTCSATGCSVVITATVSTTIGTEDVTFWKNIRLSPNPANDQALLTVHLSEATALRIKVVDATGRVVLNLPETTLLEGSLPLDLSHCPPGMYTVLLSTKNEVAVRKLVVVQD